MHHSCTLCNSEPCTDWWTTLVHRREMEQTILSQRDHMVEVGHRLRRLIDALGIPYKQAADEMGITKNHLGNWMRGDAYPRPYELYRFCRIRGVNMDWIFLGDPSGLPHRVVTRLLELEPGPSGDREAAATQEAESL